MKRTVTTTCRCGQPYSGLRVTMTIDRAHVELCGECARKEYDKRREEKGA